MWLGYFEHHYPPIYNFSVYLKDKNHPSLSNVSYKDILNDINSAMFFNYKMFNKEKNKILSMKESGYYFPLILEKQNKVLNPNHNGIQFIQQIRQKFPNHKICLLTNSFFEFSTFIIKFLFGENYISYFDFISFYSQKPYFFSKHNDPIPGYFKDLNHPLHQGDIISLDSNFDNQYPRILKEKHIIGGSFELIDKFFEKLLNKTHLNYIMVGDNFFGECEAVKRYTNNVEPILILNSLNLESNLSITPKNYGEHWGKKMVEGSFISYVLKKHKITAISSVTDLLLFNN